MAMIISHLDKKVRDFLDSVTVASIMKSSHELVTFKPNDTVEEALKKLATFAISGAPVFDQNEQKVLGYISVLDLVVWVVRTFAVSKGDRKDYDWSKLDQQFKMPISEILGEHDDFFSHKDLALPLTPSSEYGLDPFWPVPQDSTLRSLINSYFKWRIHRCPVAEKGKVVGHVSQSDVIRFLANNPKSLEGVLSKKLTDLGLDEGPVTCVLKGKSLIEAFNVMMETKFTGLAIIDEQGRLVQNISASDLKGVTKESFWKLEMPIENIIKEEKKLPVLTCSPKSTLDEVVKKLADCRVHRIYVVDNQNKPRNVITLTSIMKVFSESGSEAFA